MKGPSFVFNRRKNMGLQYLKKLTVLQFSKLIEKRLRARLFSNWINFVYFFSILTPPHQRNGSDKIVITKTDVLIWILRFTDKK